MRSLLTNAKPQDATFPTDLTRINQRSKLVWTEPKPPNINIKKKINMDTSPRTGFQDTPAGVETGVISTDTQVVNNPERK